MPLLYISMIKGKSPEYVHAVADGVHLALNEPYKVPSDDRFQIIHQCERQDFIYDAEYLGIHRSDDIVIIHIVAGNWRNADVKRAFYKRTTELLAANPGLRPEDVQIVLSSNEREDWSFGKGVASYL